MKVGDELFLKAVPARDGLKGESLSVWTRADKIIFFDRSDKPVEGNVYWCRIVRDTNPDASRKGAFIAKVVRPAKTDFRLSHSYYQGQGSWRVFCRPEWEKGHSEKTGWVFSEEDPTKIAGYAQACEQLDAAIKAAEEMLAEWKVGEQVMDGDLLVKCEFDRWGLRAAITHAVYCDEWWSERRKFEAKDWRQIVEGDPVEISRIDREGTYANGVPRTLLVMGAVTTGQRHIPFTTFTVDEATFRFVPRGEGEICAGHGWATFDILLDGVRIPVKAWCHAVRTCPKSGKEFTGNDVTTSYCRHLLPTDKWAELTEKCWDIALDAMNRHEEASDLQKKSVVVSEWEGESNDGMRGGRWYNRTAHVVTYLYRGRRYEVETSDPFSWFRERVSYAITLNKAVVAAYLSGDTSLPEWVIEPTKTVIEFARKHGLL